MKPVACIFKIGFAPVQNPMPIAAVLVVDVLTQDMRAFQIIVGQLNGRQTTKRVGMGRQNGVVKEVFQGDVVLYFQMATQQLLGPIFHPIFYGSWQVFEVFGFVDGLHTRLIFKRNWKNSLNLAVLVDNIEPPPLENNMKNSMKKVDLHTVSKEEFVKKLTNRLNSNRDQVEKIFKETLDLIVDELRAGNKIEFRGAFILGTKVNAPRQAQNPKTLEKVIIPERRSVYFKKGDRLKELELKPHAEGTHILPRRVMV